MVLGNNKAIRGGYNKKYYSLALLLNEAHTRIGVGTVIPNDVIVEDIFANGEDNVIIRFYNNTTGRESDIPYSSKTIKLISESSMGKNHDLFAAALYWNKNK